MACLETTRGCPMHCAYCSYNQQRTRHTALTANETLAIIRRLKAAGVNEIRFVDPTFNANPTFDEILRGMAEINREGRLKCFAELRADPVYRLLCEQQQCFRARVSGKPWRMGLTSLPTAERRWPVPSHREAARRQWTTHYDRQARQFAACRLLQQLGSPHMPPEIQAFVQWHDVASQAQSGLPLA